MAVEENLRTSMFPWNLTRRHDFTNFLQGRTSCRGVFDGIYRNSNFELDEGTLSEKSIKAEAKEHVDGKTLPENVRDKFWKDLHDLQRERELIAAKKNKGRKPCKVFDYRDLPSLVEQKRLNHRFENRDGLVLGLLYSFKKVEKKKAVEEYYSLTPDFDKGFLDWLAACLKWFKGKHKAGEKLEWDKWCESMWSSIRMISLTLFQFLFEKKRYIHGALPYGLALTLSGNPDFSSEEKLPEITSVKICNAEGTTSKIVDIDVPDIGKMFMMMLFGGNPLDIETIRNDDPISEGTGALFKYKDTPLSYELSDLCYKVTTTMPQWFEPKYDYVYLLVNHPAFWSDERKYRFLYDVNEILLTRMQGLLGGFIRHRVCWEDGDQQLPYHGFTTQKSRLIYDDVYNHKDDNHKGEKQQSREPDVSVGDASASGPASGKSFMLNPGAAPFIPGSKSSSFGATSSSVQPSTVGFNIPAAISATPSDAPESSKRPYPKEHVSRWGRNLVVHPNEKYKMRKEGATYTKPEVLAGEVFKDFKFAMDLHSRIGELIDRRTPANEIIIRTEYIECSVTHVDLPNKIPLTEAQRHLIRERLEAYLYLPK